MKMRVTVFVFLLLIEVVFSNFCIYTAKYNCPKEYKKYPIPSSGIDKDNCTHSLAYAKCYSDKLKVCEKYFRNRILADPKCGAAKSIMTTALCNLSLALLMALIME